jgi:hypothetical protein
MGDEHLIRLVMTDDEKWKMKSCGSVDLLMVLVSAPRTITTTLQPLHRHRLLLLVW